MRAHFGPISVPPESSGGRRAEGGLLEKSSQIPGVHDIRMKSSRRDFDLIHYSGFENVA